MDMGRSHRFARFLSSRRLLQMRVPKSYDLDVKKLKKLLAQTFGTCGRVFVAFAVKDRKLYFVETDEDYEREADRTDGDQYRMSLEALARWYNPMDLNQKQVGNEPYSMDCPVFIYRAIFSENQQMDDSVRSRALDIYPYPPIQT